MTSATLTGGHDSSQEMKTLVIISVVHLISHYYWLVFAPLMPALKDLLGVSYTELGLAITVMNLVSALTQAPTGFIVDRYGPRLLPGAAVLLDPLHLRRLPDRHRHQDADGAGERPGHLEEPGRALHEEAHARLGQAA